MLYAKQATTLFLIVLFLQAFTMCKRKTDKPASQPVSPYKKLQSGDQEEQEDYDSGYESGAELIKNDSPEKKQSTLPDHKTDNIHFDFEAQIHALRRATDAKRGIRWNLSEDRLIREVIDSGNNLYAAEDYVVQILNIYRAAKKMCALYEKDGSSFANDANEFLKYYGDHAQKAENFWTNELKNRNRNVVLGLHKMLFPNENVDSVNKKLRLTENYVGLDDTHYDVTTTFKVEDKKFALEDKKWLKLTEKQKSEFINRKSKAWYTRLDPFEQKLIDAYLDKFLDGKHYIPTQLRNIPGCRNAYQKRILAYDRNNNPTILGDYYHSAALASPIEWEDKKTDFEITEDNWKQITNQNKNVEVLSLNYHADILGFECLHEKKIVEDTMKVVGADRFMNLSTNRIGTVPVFKDQVNELLEESIIFYQKKYPKLCKAFINDKTVDREKQIAQITDLKDKAYFERLERLKGAAKKSDVINAYIQNVKQNDNHYANIGADYIACKSVLRQAHPTSSVLFSCKSGKDRTGFMSYLVDANIIFISGLSKSSEVYQTLVSSGHYQFLASVNGGMPGRFGMKPVRTNAVCRSFRNQLFPKAAQSTVLD